MTPKEYKNKMMVKVVGSTAYPSEYTKADIGKILEVVMINYRDKEVSVYSEDKEFTHIFNLSDVQIATPMMYEEVNVCLQDKIKKGGKWEEVIDCIFSNGAWRLLLGTFANTDFAEEQHIEALDPLYKEVKEELAVGSEMKLETEGGRIIKVKVIE